ncbi:MAG: flavin reductase family protein [Lachnospiraceae bacterium]|nr:flavin reductase family protein [Lachnospiraceae bacterium]MCD7766152.1 flavin reductase family protein [Lachnospiraceae bacterium]
MSRQNWKPGNMLYPLPAVMVSCARPCIASAAERSRDPKNALHCAAEERPNIITVAWAGTVCTNPAMVSISIRPERYSYSIIRETGEFVINLTTKKLARAADYCGVRSGRDVDKFKEAHLTAIPAVHVGAPLIAESPVNIECRVREVLELGSHHMFVAEVLGVDVDDRYLDDKGKLRLNDAELMVYSHGTYYELGKALGSFGYSVRKKKENHAAVRKKR